MCVQNERVITYYFNLCFQVLVVDAGRGDPDHGERIPAPAASPPRPLARPHLRLLMRTLLPLSRLLPLPAVHFRVGGSRRQTNEGQGQGEEQGEGPDFWQ